MLGCVYLILAALLGREIIRNFLPEQRMREKGITPLWVTFAASFGSGVLLMTWAVYIADICIPDLLYLEIMPLIQR